MPNGFQIDVPGGGWSAANQGLSDIGSGIGQWARQQQAMQMMERNRQNELQDQIYLATMKAKIEAQNNPFSRIKDNVTLAASLDQMGQLTPELEDALLGGMPGFSPRGGFQPTGGFGTQQPFAPATINRVDQFLNPGMPRGTSLVPSKPFGQAQPFGADEYQMVPTEFSASGRPKGFKRELTREAASKQKAEETKQQEIIKGPAEAAVGKLTLAKEALQSIADVKKIMFPDGTPSSFKRTTAFASNLPGGSLPMFPQRAWGNAEQEVFRKMSTALSARQLIQTGVAARPEETTRLISQFTPSVGSDPTAAFNALTQLEDFYKNYITEADPQYRIGGKSFESTTQPVQQNEIPSYNQKTQKLQQNKKTGEYRVVPR